MKFHLSLPINTILSCFFLFFLNYLPLPFLFSAVMAQIFSVAAELAIPAGIPTKEEKAEIETLPVIGEAKIKDCSI